MSRGLALLLALAALAILWLALAPTRSSKRPAVAPAEPLEAFLGTELAPPPAVAEAPSAEAQVRPGSARGERSAGPRKAAPEVRKRPVRGRLVVADSGDPIEASLSLRLRTIDLETGESLFTRPDGTFAGRVEFPRSRLLALVKDEEGRELVDHEAPFDPDSEDEWLVLVPAARWPTFATGRVVDRRGTPLDEVLVSLIGQAAELPLVQERSDEDGTFQLDLSPEGARLRAGPYRLLVQGYWSRSVGEVVLRAGANELGDVVLAEPAGADVVVDLVLEEPGTGPDAWLELRPEGLGPTRRFGAFDAEDQGAGRYRLRLAGVPSGRYELSAHAFDGRTYEPARLTLSPPATVELQGRGSPGSGTLFRARSKRTGEPLLGFCVFGRYGRTWGLHQASKPKVFGNIHLYEELAELRLRPGFDSWVVFAEGHRAVAGSFTGAGATIEVALEPGWSELYQFEDAEGDATAPRGLEDLQDPPVLAGVEVHADGQLAGTSDGQGFLLLAGESAPAVIEFRLPGWRVATETFLEILRTVVLAQSP